MSLSMLTHGAKSFLWFSWINTQSLTIAVELTLTGLSEITTRTSGYPEINTSSSMNSSMLTRGAKLFLWFSWINTASSRLSGLSEFTTGTSDMNVNKPLNFFGFNLFECVSINVVTFPFFWVIHSYYRLQIYDNAMVYKHIMLISLAVLMLQSFRYRSE